MPSGREALIRENWERRKDYIIGVINKYGDCRVPPTAQPEILDWPDPPEVILTSAEDLLVFKVNVLQSPETMTAHATIVCEGVELAQFEINVRNNLRQERADILHSSQR